MTRVTEEAEGGTSEHRGPAAPEGARRRPAFVCAYPRSRAVAVPDSGSVVGRAWLAENGLADTEVSGNHLRVDRRGGAMRVGDAGSRNGTWVDGARLDPRDVTPLDDGAVVRIGRTLLVYREAFSGPLEPSPPAAGMVGPFGLRAVTAEIEALARAKTPALNVLVEGETGAGKELVARAVAEALGRARPFGAVNAAGLSRGVFESQVFGHVAGAFSDARAAAPGLAVAHDGGALFLDEIGEIDLDLQAKLLRVLENREVLPVGASRTVKVDLLVVAATNKDLEAEVERGAFRRDLFARLAMARVVVPPLRARREDVFAIACALARAAGDAIEDAEVEAVERLLLEPWPTNVRGLASTLAAARRQDAAKGLRLWALEKVLGEAPGPSRALTRETVEAAIAACDGNLTSAAARLGVSRGKLLRFRKR